MSRYSELHIALRERDLIQEALHEPLQEHLKTEYKRNINHYFEQTTKLQKK